MSVYQVEQYYVYISASDLKDGFYDDAIQFLNENHADFEVVESEGVTVDGFESEYEASDFESSFMELFGK